MAKPTRIDVSKYAPFKSLLSSTMIQISAYKCALLEAMLTIPPWFAFNSVPPIQISMLTTTQLSGPFVFYTVLPTTTGTIKRGIA